MRNVAHLLFHFLDLRIEIISDGAFILLQFVHQFLSYVLTRNVDSMDGVRECIPFKYWNCIGKTLATLNY